MYENRGLPWPAWTVAVLLHGALALTAVALGWTSHPPSPAMPETIAVVFESAPPPVTAPATAPAEPEVRPPASAPQAAVPPTPQVPAKVEKPAPVASPVVSLPLPPPVRPRPEIAVAPAPKPAAAPAPTTRAALPAEPAPSPQRAASAPASVALAAVIPPRPISGIAGNRKPIYPLAARSRHLEGRVMLEVQVAASGDPVTVQVVSSSGHALLDDSAMAAVRTWRFVPATQAGQAVAGSVEVPIDFRMMD